jgi:hypothetical protein
MPNMWSNKVRIPGCWRTVAPTFSRVRCSSSTETPVERPTGANLNLLIGTAARDPVSGTAAHKSYLCEIRSAMQEREHESTCADPDACKERPV